MNDEILKELKIVVEQAVRPVQATIARKRQMREELLAHLLFTFDQALEKHGDNVASLHETLSRFGDPAELSDQLQQSVPTLDHFLVFFVNLWLIGAKNMKTRYVYRFVLLTAVLLSTAWIIFLSYTISTNTLFPGQQILITASNGADLSIENGGLRVHKGAAGMTVYHGTLIPALVIPFSIIVTVAVGGCFTVLGRRDVAARSHTVNA